MTGIDTSTKATYLTFTLAGEVFAVNVTKVREVLELTCITKVPGTPEFMRGVINLRGSVVPVVDLRLKFSLPAASDTVDTCIIVMEVDIEGDATIIGAVADSVREVFEMGNDQIEPPPKIGTRLRTDYITGMGRQDDRFTIILDIDRVFSADELALVDQVASEGDAPSPAEPPPPTDSVEWAAEQPPRRKPSRSSG